MPLPRVLLASLVALVILAACGGEPSDPGPLAASYTLRQLNDSLLPYDHEGLGCCTYLSGDLELDGGAYTMGLMAHNRNTGVIFTAREWGTYVRAGSRVTFARDSFQIVPFLLDVATLSGDTLRVAFGGEGPGSPDQFRAVFVGGS
jgi:hypothetical protein